MAHPNEPSLPILLQRRRELYAFKTDDNSSSRENAKRIEAIDKQISRHKAENSAAAV